MDDLWYSEYHTKSVKFSIQLKKQLHTEVSDYQTISVYDSVEFGRFLTLDGVMMMTEKDEFIYHEMMTHIPMAVNPETKKVLVIGAGDGGVLRELTKYQTIESIDLVEIDERVIEVCKEYLPCTAVGFEDPRVHVCIQDGIKFIRRVEQAYDLIIVDSTDPFGPGEVLFTKEFYGSCYKALTDKGILVNQQESPFYPEDAANMRSAYLRLKSVFPVVKVCQAHIPTYPSGHWCFGFASKGFHPVKDIKDQKWERQHISTRYYNLELHRGAFCLPNYVKENLEHE